MTTLAALGPGEKARVVRVPADKTGKRLVELGMTRGTVVEMAYRAPLGDPLTVCLLGYALALRVRQASLVEVEKIP